MAYVAPNGIIQLFHGISLTTAYEHTLWFDTRKHQDDYFSQIVYKQFATQMYTRVSEGVCKVEAVADSIMDCDYMRFQNTRAGVTKWFYAFITKIEYINENVSYIHFEIDEIQTWYFDGWFKPCFIERQHDPNDSTGYNTQPEPLDANEHVVVSSFNGVYSTSIGYIVVLGTITLPSVDPNNNIFSTCKFSGYASTLKFIYFTSHTTMLTFLNGCQFIDGAITGVFQSEDAWSIVAMYAVPSDLFSYDPNKTITINGASGYMLTSLPLDIEVTDVTRPSSNTPVGFDPINAGTYVPKNNKLKTYPYTYLEIETPISSQIYKYESFGNNLKFNVYGCCNPEPSIVIVPQSYNHDENNYRYALTVEGFPQLPVYESGMFEGAGRVLANGFKTAVLALITKGVSEVGFAQIGSGLSGGAKTFKIASAINRYNEDTKLDLPRLSTHGEGAGTGGSTNLAPLMAQKDLPAADDRSFTISFNHVGLRKDIAEKFDKFLSKYGYAMNTVAVPNVHARENWTYIKTRDCNFTGYLPAESAAKINAIMNSGITWWTWTKGVGNYGNFDNPFVSVG